MKQFFSFVVCYAIPGAVAWLAIEARHESVASPPDASMAPATLHGRTSEPLQPDYVPARLLSLASPVVPMPAPTTPWLGEMGTYLKSELRCLALNVYWEARSESYVGQVAVAAVTLNRVAHERFPGSICEVVRQGGVERRNCQFSWWCDGKSDVPTNDVAWQLAKSIAYTALFFDPLDPTDGALWYHADYVNPSWTRAMSHTVTIGRHIYYRNPMQSKRKTIASNS